MPSLTKSMAGMLPVVNSHLLACTVAATGFLTLYYYAVHFGLKSREQTERQKSWVLTLLSSAIMTLASLPYLWHWVRTGNVDLLHGMADYFSCFFIAYLTTDLAIGSMHYRSSISLLTGWIHHVAYMLLLTFVVIPHGYSSLFALCCILELPTLLLAAGNLKPALRNDYVFATIFFLTRIVLHIFIGVQYALRALSPLQRGTWTPTLVLCCALPMHVLWMKACVSGILRRRAIARQASASTHQPPPLTVRVGNIPAYLLSRPLVASALDNMRARRIASSTLLRRSRQHVLRLLHDALREAEVQGTTTTSAAANVQSQPQTQGQVQTHPQHPKWRSIRRRVAGRIRSSLPEYEGVVASAVLLPPVVAEEIADSLAVVVQ